MKTYHVGILGFGMIGKVHAYGYQALPFFYDPVPLQARITHVVTGHAETAEKARQMLAADVAATDHRAVTENPDIDIVHICTPNHLHKDALLSAMRQQKHIYCDKPLTATAAEAAEVRAALKDYRGIAQMTFQNRFYPATMRAKQLVEAGALGQILEFRAFYLHGSNADPERADALEADGGGRRRGDCRPGLAPARHARLADRPVPSGHGRQPDRLSLAAGGRRLDEKVVVDVEDNVLLWPGCNRGPWARSWPRSWPPAARTSSAWKFTAPRRGAVQQHEAALLGVLRRRRWRRDRWEARAAGPASIAASVIRRRPQAFPAPRRRWAGSAATWPVWRAFCRRLPAVSPPHPAWNRGFASNF